MNAGTPPPDLEDSLRRFLAEDLGGGDVTAESVVPAQARARGDVRLKAHGVLAGADLAEPIVRLLDPGARAEAALRDGTVVDPGTTAVTLFADARALLAAERTLINLMQRMSGIATLTRRYVEAVAGCDVAILDTRKTAPGLRWFDKRAVVAGGGVNHRRGLDDQILIKSNHLIFGVDPDGRRPIERIVAAARAGAPRGTPLQIEVFDAAEAVRAAEAGAELVLLDNFSPAQVRSAVAEVRRRFSRERVGLEASGGITLENVRAFAEAGVDRISIGALTHSAPALDLSLAVRVEAA